MLYAFTNVGDACMVELLCSVSCNIWVIFIHTFSFVIKCCTQIMLCLKRHNNKGGPIVCANKTLEGPSCMLFRLDKWLGSESGCQLVVLDTSSNDVLVS